MLDLIRRCWRDPAFRTFVVPTAGALLVMAFAVTLAQARDFGQWANSDPAIRAWYRGLMQPDNPAVPCCGQSDAYWADKTETGPNGELIAVITDDRPNEPLMRRPVPIGTRIVVPPHKIQWRYGNPTGHTVIFLSAANEPYCYVQNGGV